MIRLRTLLACALVCGSLTAALPSAVTADAATASAACTWAGYSITARQSTPCATARKALKFYYGGGGASQGYRCKATASSGYTAGKCRSGRTKSFRFALR